MTRKLVLALLLEIAYAVGTRTWLRQWAAGIELELWTTVVRMFSALAIWLLFRELLRSREAEPGRALNPMAGIGLLLWMTIPVLAGNQALPDRNAQWVFALCSIAVAVREEFFYRGVLQNLLEQRLGWLWAIGLSNVLFVGYHYGAQPFTLSTLVGLFAGGTILGLLYRGTGSLVLVIAVHALYDVLWSLAPLATSLFPEVMAAALGVIAALFVLAWGLRVERAPGSS